MLSFLLDDFMRSVSILLKIDQLVYIGLLRPWREG